MGLSPDFVWPEHWEQVDLEVDRLFVCPACFAIVTWWKQEKHQEWHTS